jgi:hypothetical protein
MKRQLRIPDFKQRVKIGKRMRMRMGMRENENENKEN